MDTKDIYHYTFGLVLKGGGRSWRLDKRMYYGGYPADHLQMPPACTAKSGFIMAGLWNEAAQGIEGWPNRVATPREDGHADTPLARLLSITPDDGAALPPLVKLLRGTGPWEWVGAGMLYLFARGSAALAAPGTTSNKPPKTGSWRATEACTYRRAPSNRRLASATLRSTPRSRPRRRRSPHRARAGAHSPTWR